MKNFLKIFNCSTIVFAVSSVHLFAQSPVSSNSPSDRPANQNNQANFQEMNQKRKENRDKIQELKMENQKIRETQNNIQINDLMKMKDRFSNDNEIDIEITEIDEDIKKSK